MATTVRIPVGHTRKLSEVPYSLRSKTTVFAVVNAVRVSSGHVCDSQR